MSAMNDAATRGLWAQALLLGLAIGWLADAVEAAPGRWSSAGPYGGRIDSAALSPLEPGVVYASAHRSVYRSDDGGNSWSNQSAGLSTLSAGTTRLAAHPALPGYVLLAGARGVFLSVNSGRSWFRRDSGLPVNNSSFHTVDVAYAPSNPAVLYLASEDDGLYRSSNGGASWVAVGAPSLPTDLIRIAVDPGDAQSLLVWVGDRNTNDYPASLYRSSNGGLSFTPVSGPWDSGGPIREDIQLLAYNAPYDRQVLTSDLTTAGLDPAHLADRQNWVCLMRARALVENRGWVALGGPHHALGDCLATLDVLHGIARRPT